MDAGDRCEESLTQSRKRSSLDAGDSSAQSSKRKSMTSAGPMIRKISPAQFLKKNMKSNGFYNAGMSLYRTIRELVENSLDAAELINELPSVQVIIQEIDDTIYKVICKDNGCGISHDDIPELLGQVLCGTNFGLKQTRGKDGIGATMALIWAQMTTGKPVNNSTSTKGQSYTSVCELEINIEENLPVIKNHVKALDKEPWHGTEIELVIEGNWSSYRSYILQYMRQIAIITPYAEFAFKYTTATQGSVSLEFPRRSNSMPSAPLEMKYHPSSVDLILLKELINENPEKELLQFLQDEFDKIELKLAIELIGELGFTCCSKTRLKSLTMGNVIAIYNLFREISFPDPSGDCLRPVGEHNLYMGIKKELQPDMVATFTSSTKVCQGHPFVVEAAVSLGGNCVKPGFYIYRFANKIPLLFEGTSDVVRQTAINFNWNRYKINPAKHIIGVFASIVGTKLPFNRMLKEYIEEVDEIKFAIKATLEKCCMQLKPLLAKKASGRSIPKQTLKGKPQSDVNQPNPLWIQPLDVKAEGVVDSMSFVCLALLR